jgi:ElaB/YqjD/DUF883 family membrane-anchored ribosome-binding protein
MTIRTTGLERDVRNVVSEVEALLSDAGEEGSTRARAAQERVIRVLDEAKDRLARLDDTVRMSARQAAETTDDFVHDRPWQTAALAIGLGILAGLLIARR